MLVYQFPRNVFTRPEKYFGNKSSFNLREAITFGVQRRAGNAAEQSFIRTVEHGKLKILGRLSGVGSKIRSKIVGADDLGSVNMAIVAPQYLLLTSGYSLSVHDHRGPSGAFEFALELHTPDGKETLCVSDSRVTIDVNAKYVKKPGVQWNARKTTADDDDSDS